jgi:hypothetical protein
MQVEVGHHRDFVFAGACVLLALVISGHIWMDELLAWVQWFIATVIVPVIGLDQFF